MKPSNLIRYIAITFFVCTTANATEIVSQEIVTDDWFETSIRWTEGPPSYKGRWKAMVKGGVVIVCGAGTYTSGAFRQTQKVLQGRGFFIDDTLYLKDITFFARVNRGTKLVGARANCASTGKRPPRVVKDGVSLRPLDPKKVYRF